MPTRNISSLHFFSSPPPHPSMYNLCLSPFLINSLPPSSAGPGYKAPSFQLLSASLEHVYWRKLEIFTDRWKNVCFSSWALLKGKWTQSHFGWLVKMGQSCQSRLALLPWGFLLAICETTVHVPQRSWLRRTDYCFVSWSLDGKLSQKPHCGRNLVPKLISSAFIVNGSFVISVNTVYNHRLFIAVNSGVM